MALAAVLLMPGNVSSQMPVPAVAPAGGVVEHEHRVRQLTGGIPLRIWSIRAFNANELATLLRETLDSLPSHLVHPTSRLGPGTWRIMPAEIRVTANSGFPYGFNDGPVWAGRGLTIAAMAGVAGEAGPFSLRLSPIAFLSQNAPFEPALDGSVLLNSLYSKNIDLPQRFGSRSYGRIDPGESEIRLQLGSIGAGMSTATQVWGPAVDHPLILGNNAGGFPHAFVGTAHPVQLRGATFHSRWIWGRVDASSFSPGSESHHFVTGAVGAMTVPGLPGLELGAIRFFHMEWPDDGVLRAPFLAVLQGLLKQSFSTSSNPDGDVPGDNQLASLFMRWAFPTSGVEIYAEYGREDHNWNLRDFWQEIDHDAAFLLGVQRAWGRPNGRTTAFRIEHLNTRMGKLHPIRPQAPWYVHGVRVQGHTQRGQLLGSAGGFGGGATVLAVDRFSRDSRTTVRWDRMMRAEQLASDIPDVLEADVMHALTFERARRSAQRELTFGATAVVDLNRDFRRDAFNLQTTFSYRRLR
jgi:hypothetical protein